MDARLSEEQELIRETAQQLAARFGPLPTDQLPAKGDGAEAWREQLVKAGVRSARLEVGDAPTEGLHLELIR